MPRHRIIDPDINAVCGVFVAPSMAVALNAAVRRAGWDDYADYVRGAAAHSGVRTLEAVEEQRQPLRLVS